LPNLSNLEFYKFPENDLRIPLSEKDGRKGAEEEERNGLAGGRGAGMIRGLLRSLPITFKTINKVGEV